MFLRNAMRYYRLWIYTCNAVLFVSVLVFVAVSIGVLSNSTLSLVPTPAPYHPTVLYGYLALFLQAGVLQAIGCLGALRLNKNLLNIYWFLLLLILLCDLLVGFFWLVKFSNLSDGVKPFLQKNLHMYYNKDKRLTDVWDSIQSSEYCCGSQGPMDYLNITSSTILPDSCCHYRRPTLPLTAEVSKSNSDHIYRYKNKNIQPDSVISRSSKKNLTKNFYYRRMSKVRPTSSAMNNQYKSGKMNSNSRIINSNIKKMNFSCRDSDKVPHYNGCSDHIMKWYKGSTETLMILGFCVITFIKLCFVGILRVEIQEMIQKIKLIQADLSMNPNPELAEALGMICSDKTVDNGDAPHPRSSISARSRGASLFPTDFEESNPSVGHGGTHGLLIRHNHISSAMDGAESDTNSYCQLITDTPVRNPPQAKRKPNGNNNELTEMREFRQTEI